jgi:hypothetical protein
LRELYREFVVAKRRAIHDTERDLSMAWHIAAFSRQPRLPDLGGMLTRVRGTQGPADLRGAVQAISEVYQLKLRKGKRRRG